MVVQIKLLVVAVVFRSSPRSTLLAISNPKFRSNFLVHNLRAVKLGAYHCVKVTVITCFRVSVI